MRKYESNMRKYESILYSKIFRKIYKAGWFEFRNHRLLKIKLSYSDKAEISMK